MTESAPDRSPDSGDHDAPARIQDQVAKRDAIERQARTRLNRIEEIWDAYELHLAGYSQREIAQTLITTQPRVHRMLKAAQIRDGEFWTPEYVILLKFVGEIDSEEMVTELMDREYTFTEFAPYPLEGSRRGTWDQVTEAHMSEFISDDEFERVRSAINPPEH